jgi:26S proteasome regulatory subunit N5
VALHHAWRCSAAAAAQVSPKAFAKGSKDQEAGEISLQGTAIEQPEEGTPAMPALKVRYYEQMICFHKQSNNYLEIVRCLLAMYADKEEAADALATLKQVVWYALKLSSVIVRLCLHASRSGRTLSLV